MQRRVLLFLMMVLLVTGSATGVHASTDCQRWFDAYKQQLAHSQAVKRLQAAKLRARRYAQMKLAGYVKPKAVAKPHSRYPHRPRMTRAEALRRLNLACGVLPEDEADQPSLKSEKMFADFTSERAFALLPEVDSNDEQMLASTVPPSFPFMGAPAIQTTVDMPPIYTPPMWGNPGIPGHVVFPGGAGPVPPAVAAVPEAESIVLLLIGLIGGAGMIPRRI
jgi:hypothetical protein